MSPWDCPPIPIAGRRWLRCSIVMPKVIYIAGKGRSGSTLLDAILGQVPGVASTGELWHLWTWGLQRGYPCGCGQAIPRCGHWQKVLDDAFPGDVDAAAIARLQDRVMTWPMVPRLLATHEAERWRDLRRLIEVQRRLYSSLADVAGAQVVVDSSKFPAHPGLLSLIPGIQPFLVHLVRDARAVTYSYRRHKASPDRGRDHLPQFGPVHSATSWMARNLTLEVVKATHPTVPSLRVRYEDLVGYGRSTTRRILRHVGLEAAEPPFEDERTLRLAPSHTVGGNPDRFRTGSVALRLDDEWRTAIGPLDRAVTTLLTWPLLHRYGYNGRRDDDSRSVDR